LHHAEVLDRMLRGKAAFQKKIHYSVRPERRVALFGSTRKGNKKIINELRRGAKKKGRESHKEDEGTRALCGLLDTSQNEKRHL